MTGGKQPIWEWPITAADHPTDGHATLDKKVLLNCADDIDFPGQIRAAASVSPADDRDLGAVTPPATLAAIDHHQLRSRIIVCC